LKLVKNCFCHIGARIDFTLWIGSKCCFNCTVGYEDDHKVFACIWSARFFQWWRCRCCTRPTVTAMGWW
jgi:hypothetical protein